MKHNNDAVIRHRIVKHYSFFASPINVHGAKMLVRMKTPVRFYYKYATYSFRFATEKNYSTTTDGRPLAVELLWSQVLAAKAASGSYCTQGRILARVVFKRAT